MKVLNLLGLYTKGQYLEGMIKAKAHGYQSGRTYEKRESSIQLLSSQLKIDEKNEKINQLYNQIMNNELDLQCKEAELASIYDKKICRLENLRKRTKSYRKRKKIDNRINELEFKKLEI